MKHSKMSRRISIALSALMVIGGISVNTYAENLDSELEIMVDESYTEGMEDFVTDEEFGVEDEVVFDEVSIEGEDEGIIISDVEEIVVDSSVVESETTAAAEDDFLMETPEVVDTAQVEAMLLDDVNGVTLTSIVLNYEAYTLKAVGETVLLTADVVAPEIKTAETEATAADDVMVMDAEAEAETNADPEVTAAPVAVDAFTVESVSEADNNVSWVSSDEAVVTVDEFGIVTAVASGEALITCTLNADPSVTASCKITVAAGCTLQEHVHSLEECFVRELICDHTSADDHTADCYLNKFVCGMEEHVHDEVCFEHTDAE